MSDESPQLGKLRIPLLPLRDIIVFPSMVVPLFVGRQKSIHALKQAMGEDKQIVLCAQRVATTNEPAVDDIFDVGTLGIIKQLIQLPDGTVKVLVMGQSRVKIDHFIDQEEHFVVEVTVADQSIEMTPEFEQLLKTVRETFASYVKLNRRIPPEILNQIAKIEEPSRLADTIVAQLALKLGAKQDILETFDVSARLQKLLELMQKEIEILQVERKIRSRVKKQMEKSQKDYYLEDGQEQPPKEAQDGNEFKNEIEELEAKIKAKAMSDEARDRVNRELKKLKMMSPMSAEATVVRNYIDWVLSIPWEDRTEDELSLQKAQDILDRDHFGLDKPKDRIIEYLAVRSLVDKPRGPILCLVGPPGVGKTSLGRSIAESLGRKFVRLSLGGVRDEAEIRGHRRTYIGALPGKIIQSMRKAESSNPVFLLDEIDKMSNDFRGDPSSALLEVLDPEQNSTFNDHYLDLDFDLSNVMFICTANELSGIPGPLRDRMELIRLPGYTDDEKLQIARNYLVSKQQEANGLQEKEITFDDGALRTIVEAYTREAGVRNLEREIGSVFRKIARALVQEQSTAEHFTVNADDIPEYLGPPYYSRTIREEDAQVGLTNGLAWTQMGGVLLLNEVAIMPGTGKVTLTGKLGDVMQESAQAAMSYVRSRALNLGLRADFHKKIDLHIHFPEGALPKDGPSAGITITTSIVSCLTQTPVRHDIAMTGEITLRGRVLPIGGLKEKVLAAHRTGMKTVLFPKDNVKDLKDIPQEIRDKIELIPVAHVDEVLLHALVLEHPEGFEAQLKQPVLPPDILFDEQAQAIDSETTSLVGDGSTFHTH